MIEQLIPLLTGGIGGLVGGNLLAKLAGGSNVGAGSGSIIGIIGGDRRPIFVGARDWPNHWRSPEQWPRSHDADRQSRFRRRRRWSAWHCLGHHSPHGRLERAFGPARYACWSFWSPIDIVEWGRKGSQARTVHTNPQLNAISRLHSLDRLRRKATKADRSAASSRRSLTTLDASDGRLTKPPA